MPSTRRVICSVALMLSGGVASAQSLCKASETIYFSCRIAASSKFLSLCGGDYSKTSSFWLQYRFGTLKKLDFAFPPSNDRGVVGYSEAGFDIAFHKRPHRFDTEVGFVHQGMSYTVFNWQDGPDRNREAYGVFVAQSRAGPGKTYRCGAPPTAAVVATFRALAAAESKPDE
jgi:hypothetical protein